MTSDPLSEHRIETYKSLIQISVEGFRLLALLNGGAAVALLAYLGNIAAKGMPGPDVRWPLACFLLGLVLCGLSFFGSYYTQLKLFNEAMGRTVGGQHVPWLWGTGVIALASLASFAAGSWVAVSAFGSLPPAAP